MDSQSKKPFGLEEPRFFNGEGGRLKELRNSFQGARHLAPKNLSPLRSQLEKQLTNLKEVNQLTSVKPPFVHRPGESRYVSSTIVKQQKQA